jgi:hypothetical protein
MNDLILILTSDAELTLILSPTGEKGEKGDTGGVESFSAVSPLAFDPVTHILSHPGTHDDRYYLKAEVDAQEIALQTNIDTEATTRAATAPSAGEKAALAGTTGTPSDVNRYVTDTDPRLGSDTDPVASSTVSGTVKTDTDAVDPVVYLQTTLDTLLNLKANLASPALTGTPTTPTAAPGTNTGQIASTAFVAAAVAALIAAAPGALDTLKELADAIGDDSNFAATVSTALAGKQPLDAELTALAGLVSAADQLPYFSGSGTATLATLTAFARTLLDDTDASTARATLGLAALAVLNTVGTAQIDNSAVTYAKIQNVTDARLLGRSAGSAGAPQEIAVGTGLNLSAGTLSATGGAGGSGLAARTLLLMGG